MWKGIQDITNYRTTSPDCAGDASLPDALNNFYARFEAENDMAARKSTPPTNDQVLCLTVADVRRTLYRVNPQNAAGPDDIPGRVLRGCADQLADVLTDIFNISLSNATVPTCFKAAIIVPMPKKSSVSCLNDYRPIALTSCGKLCISVWTRPSADCSCGSSHRPLYKGNSGTAVPSVSDMSCSLFAVNKSLSFTSSLLELLMVHHIHHHEVFREAHHEAYQDPAAPLTGPPAVCVPSQPLNR
ncbi:uncharacterized protein LOC132404845 [Hypanus sabinus]|uniref:uncharacterized protein LOC132404845 n=1 Tax=Hypanus sabinus TaxID=79690 RepID=UPI0028C46FE9|nr:uncharacterized protein LOC132404845 [Hypanus sabinus]